MSGTNDLGPFGAGVQETSTEPANFGDSGGGTYTWFKDCTAPGVPDGTKYTAQWANRILKYIRRACDGMGITRDETDTDRLLKALQKADRVIVNYGSAGVSLYAGYDANPTWPRHQIRKLEAGAGIAIAVDGNGQAVVSLDFAPEDVIFDTIAPELFVRLERAGNTAAQVFSLGSNSRTLNTLVRNTITGASLGSGQITLPVGKYRARFDGVCTESPNHQSVLYNVTAGAELGTGSSVDADDGDASNSTGYTTFTLAAISVIELRHMHNSTTTDTVRGGDDTDISPRVHCDAWVSLVKTAAS